MTILQVVQDVCAQVGVAVPSSVFAPAPTGARTMTEMLALANEQAQRMAYDTREWTKLKKEATFTGDGATTAFLLPADYKRMLLTSNVWRSTSTQQPMLHIGDTDDWFRRRRAGETDAWGEWTLFGDDMHIWPPMGTDTVASFVYLQRNCVRLAGGGYGDRFVNDADSYRLDERLLKLNMLWQWKAHKGSPFAEDMGTYMDALANATGADKPATIIVDRYPISANARVSSSWPIGWGS